MDSSINLIQKHTQTHPEIKCNQISEHPKTQSNWQVKLRHGLLWSSQISPGSSQNMENNTGPSSEAGRTASSPRRGRFMFLPPATKRVVRLWIQRAKSLAACSCQPQREPLVCFQISPRLTFPFHSIQPQETCMFHIWTWDLMWVLLLITVGTL